MIVRSITWEDRCESILETKQLSDCKDFIAAFGGGPLRGLQCCFVSIFILGNELGLGPYFPESTVDFLANKILLTKCQKREMGSVWCRAKLWDSEASPLLPMELRTRGPAPLFPKELTIFITFRNLSEPVMTYRLHKELVSAASKYLWYYLIVLSRRLHKVIEEKKNKIIHRFLSLTKWEYSCLSSDSTVVLFLFLNQCQASGLEEIGWCDGCD